MHYEESGTGAVFVFLHGNPASSRVWRKVTPLLGEGRPLAASADVPKLLMTFEGSPTLLITSDMTAWCAASMAALETAHCGSAGHHAPEDRPAEIAAAISAWADRHALR